MLLRHICHLHCFEWTPFKGGTGVSMGVINFVSHMLALCTFLLSIEYQCIIFIREHPGCYLVRYRMVVLVLYICNNHYLMMGNWINMHKFHFVPLYCGFEHV